MNHRWLLKPSELLPPTRFKSQPVHLRLNPALLPHVAPRCPLAAFLVKLEISRRLGRSLWRSGRVGVRSLEDSPFKQTAVIEADSRN